MIESGSDFMTVARSAEQDIGATTHKHVAPARQHDSSEASIQTNRPPCDCGSRCAAGSRIWNPVAHAEAHEAQL